MIYPVQMYFSGVTARINICREMCEDTIAVNPDPSRCFLRAVTPVTNADFVEVGLVVPPTTTATTAFIKKEKMSR
jgi:hypothetical protein